MKITIDTTRKVITLDQEVKLKDLFDFLQDLLKDDWQQYKLEVQTIYVDKYQPLAPFIQPTNPYPWNPTCAPENPYQPWKGTEIWYTMQTNTNG